MENTFQQIFKREYNRTSFTDNVLLPIFQNSVKEIKIFEEQALQEVELTETDLKSAKRIFKYGELVTNDNRQIDLYEVTLQDTKKVKLARVGIGALVKKLIIGNNAAFVNFRYENIEDRHWRFSFISYDSFFEEGEVISKETNPKRYTYVFGDEDETYWTAIDRFLDLYNATNIKVKNIQDAFAVEAMSEEFFKEYREVHYQNFIRFLTGEEIQKKGSKYELVKVQEPSSFLISVFNGDKKEARDFCKKLLGQIVFLYFLQKKGWLGASNTNYRDGDKNFIQNFYKQAGENDAFYAVWLAKLFYDTLNEKREADNFTMPNGESVKIPYLNGGLFEKENSKYDFLVFPADLFGSLFEFFNRFNFTIYENSPEEHTIAVDPEMLGHIFENLLEDNKDKGAFYTPKEIVQYMTQESLIEYLATHVGQDKKEGITIFVKQKNKELLSDKVLKQIDRLLDDVKVCDPAIGSGAFPMGLLQEIFMLKERIAFDSGFKDWNPATVKENIIQNSIYGVDIEKGAVDIAQLRFWLSLVVDEDKPKPLPNLAYKIIVGNSLVSKFGDEIIEIDWEVKANTQFDMFASDLEKQKTWLLKEISNKQKQFFSASNKEKEKIKKEIRKLKLEILSTQLELMIETKGVLLDNSKKKSKKQTEAWLETEGWKRAIKEINILRKNDKHFEHFDWKLDFPEILNPLVNENAGFDIVIANPPYVGEKGNKKTFTDVKKGFLRKHYKSKMDLFYFFHHLSYEILLKNGVTTFITTNYFLTADGAVTLRNEMKKNLTPLLMLNFNEFKIFDSAYGQHNIITILQKGVNKQKCKIINTNHKALYDRPILQKILNGNDSKTNYFETSNIFDGENDYIRIGSSKTSLTTKILEKIKLNKKSLDKFLNINSGCDITISKVTNTHIKNFGNNLVKDEGVFVLSKNELKSLSLNSYEESLVKPFVKNSDIASYDFQENDNLLLYINWNENESDIPNIIKHLSKYRNISEDQKVRYNEPTWPWYSIHRPREIEIFNSNNKIIVPYRSLSNNFAYSNKPIFASRDVFFLTQKESINVKYLLAILNSSLIYFWLFHRGKRKGETLELYATPLSEIPIAQSQNIEPFVTLVDYILFLKSTETKDIQQKLKSTYFKQIIDGMVYELYFPDLLHKHKRTIIEHLGALPAFTENTTDSQKQEIIDIVFKRLDDKNHAVRNNLFYMSNIEEIAIIEGKNN